MDWVAVKGKEKKGNQQKKKQIQTKKEGCSKIVCKQRKGVRER